MTVGVYGCTICGNTTISYDYGLRILGCTKWKTPLRDFEKDGNSWDEVSF